MSSQFRADAALISPSSVPPRPALEEILRLVQVRVRGAQRVLAASGQHRIGSGLTAILNASTPLLVTFLTPVSAIVLGTLILGKTLLARQVAGMRLIGLGLALIDGRLPRALSWTSARVSSAGNGARDGSEGGT